MPPHSSSTGVTPKNAESDPLYCLLFVVLTLANAGVGGFMIWVGFDGWDDCDYDVPKFLVTAGIAAVTISAFKLLHLIAYAIMKDKNTCGYQVGEIARHNRSVSKKAASFLFDSSFCALRCACACAFSSSLPC